MDDDYYDDDDGISGCAGIMLGLIMGGALTFSVLAFFFKGCA